MTRPQSVIAEGLFKCGAVLDLDNKKSIEQTDAIVNMVLKIQCQASCAIGIQTDALFAHMLFLEQIKICRNVLLRIT